MLKRTRERGVRLNPDKCQICVSEVSYFGHTLSREGVKPDPVKVKAIQDMQPPTSRGELETILGMVNYLARFAPRLSEINAPLRQLLKQDSEFLWDKNHDKAFTQTKKLITDHPVLAYFDPQKELRLQVDASKCGLGAVMLQDEKPIAYASKSLNSTEVNYAQIEKELYAVLFGCKRFHEYMYGRRVIVESDHKPLEAILRKPLAAVPPRLQRMILQLQKYNIHIIHRPGKDIPVADTLSRKSIEHQDSSLMESMEAQVHTLISTVPVSDRKLLEIKDATAQDAQLTALRRATQNGWPNERRKCPPSIQEYWNHRDEISEMEGILF
uniref:Reverse transcriptase/retrotransposon-derived protein RNase H-like domain-containing protein n=1 Tax=Cyprinus carpio TaxID=7962 RepID=A0A8C2F8L8_CYPCA